MTKGYSDGCLDEEWRDIDGYRGLYKVSSYGRVKGLRNNTILKGEENNCGYQRVSLYKDKRKQRFLVHRLVAEAFVPNPYDKPIVNHRNECPYDNYYQNLEWADYSYNQLYGTIRERKSRNRKATELRKRLLLYSNE